MTRKIIDLEKEFDTMRSQMNTLMNNIFKNSPMEEKSLLSAYNNEDANRLMINSNLMRTPLININEKNDEALTSIELPGVKKENIKLDIENKMLNIKAHNNDEREDEKEGYFTYEKIYNGFEKSVPIPDYIDEEKVSAKYDNGVLNVHMPKKKEAKTQTKYINIE